MLRYCIYLREFMLEMLNPPSLALIFAESLCIVTPMVSMNTHVVELLEAEVLWNPLLWVAITSNIDSCFCRADTLVTCHTGNGPLGGGHEVVSCLCTYS